MDNKTQPNPARRRFLTTAATVVGGAGAAVAAVPFLYMMAPSAKTRQVGGPVEVDLRGMTPGEQRIAEWRGRAIWVIRRNRAALNALEDVSAVLSDPDSEKDQQPAYARNPHRSLRPEFLVLEGICTHLGCSPQYFGLTEPVPGGVGDRPWAGGFLCACHGSFFDLAGRVYKGLACPAVQPAGAAAPVPGGGLPVDRRGYGAAGLRAAAYRP